jgi:hypothetical protein
VASSVDTERGHWLLCRHPPPRRACGGANPCNGPSSDGELLIVQGNGKEAEAEEACNGEALGEVVNDVGEDLQVERGMEEDRQQVARVRR